MNGLRVFKMGCGAYTTYLPRLRYDLMDLSDRLSAYRSMNGYSYHRGFRSFDRGEKEEGVNAGVEVGDWWH